MSRSTQSGSCLARTVGPLATQALYHHALQAYPDPQRRRSEAAILTATKYDCAKTRRAAVGTDAG
jgi:hypothetical protein